MIMLSRKLKRTEVGDTLKVISDDPAFNKEIKIWSYETGNWIDSSATLGPNGTVIFPSRDNNIYCLMAAGGGNGTTNELTGEERFLWKYSAEGISNSSPVISPDGNIIVGSSCPSEKWRHGTSRHDTFIMSQFIVT